MRVSRRVLLPVPLAEAWSVLTDWERQAEWMRDADRVEVLSAHREGTGVVLAVRTRVLHIPAFTERIEVVAWEPPSRLRIAHGGPIGGTGDWLLDATTGGTRFTWVEDVELPWGVLGRAALFVYRPFLRYLMGGAMHDLRRSLKAAADPGSAH